MKKGASLLLAVLVATFMFPVQSFATGYRVLAMGNTPLVVHDDYTELTLTNFRNAAGLAFLPMPVRRLDGGIKIVNDKESFANATTGAGTSRYAKTFDITRPSDIFNNAFGYYGGFLWSVEDKHVFRFAPFYIGRKTDKFQSTSDGRALDAQGYVNAVQYSGRFGNFGFGAAMIDLPGHVKQTNPAASGATSFDLTIRNHSLLVGSAYRVGLGDDKNYLDLGINWRDPDHEDFILRSLTETDTLTGANVRFDTNPGGTGITTTQSILKLGNLESGLRLTRKDIKLWVNRHTIAGGGAVSNETGRYLSQRVNELSMDFISRYRLGDTYEVGLGYTNAGSQEVANFGTLSAVGVLTSSAEQTVEKTVIEDYSIGLGVHPGDKTNLSAEYHLVNSDRETRNATTGVATKNAPSSYLLATNHTISDYRLGAERWLSSGLALRLGYRLRMASSNEATFSDFTTQNYSGGVGLKFGDHMEFDITGIYEKTDKSDISTTIENQANYKDRSTSVLTSWKILF